MSGGGLTFGRIFIRLPKIGNARSPAYYGQEIDAALSKFRGMNWQHSLILFLASMIAGAVNSVAGGGTLLTFPALMATGHAAIIANATSTVALWPGQLSSLWGYRKEIGQTRSAILPLTVLGLIGGIVGASLLLVTPGKTFDKLVPFLVLAATSLFMAQEPLARRQRARAAQFAQDTAQTNDAPAQPDADSANASPAPTQADTSAASAPSGTTAVFRRLPLPIGLLAFAIAIYGGYFGAGIGILTLAALGFLGFTNIHQMNGVKNIFTLFINGVAALIFVFKHLVDYSTAGLMAAGAIFGGYAGAGIARRIGQKNVRRVVIGLGFVLTVQLLWRAWIK